MRFGEKILTARKELRLSRQQLSEITGLSKRTLAYYELDHKLPKKKSTYEVLARALNMEAANLADDRLDFEMKRGYTSGAQTSVQAERLLCEIRGLYAGGMMKDEDMDAMMLAINEAYWIAKKKSADRRKKSGNDELI